LNVATGTTTPALTIDNAAADGSTKGAASFTAADFDSTTGNISIDYTNGQAAATAAKGFLTAADWNTFNGKQDTITPANLTETTSSILTITGGTGATLEGVTIAVTKADTTNSGYLDTTDWDTFNDKASTTAPTFATSVTGSYLTASEMLITGADKKIISAPVATYPSLAELAYVKGLTSAVQTQLNAKADVYSTTFVDGDLAAGVLTVTHNLGTKLVSVTVFNNDDQICWPDLVTLSSTSACAVDLSSYGTLVGTWGVRAAE